jgi:Adenylosuccinate synthetase
MTDDAGWDRRISGEIHSSWRREEDIVKNLKIGNPDIVFPWHKLVDLDGAPNSSTGKWMTQVHGDKTAKRHTRLDDLLNEDYTSLERSYTAWMRWLLEKYKTHEELEKHFMANFSDKQLPTHLKEFLRLHTDEAKLKFVKEQFTQSAKWLNPYRINVWEYLYQTESQWLWLVEVPQATYLEWWNQIHGRTATAARTSWSGAAQCIPVSLDKKRALSISVVKVPSSRVGTWANPAWLVEQNWFDTGKLKADKLPEIDYIQAHTQFMSLIREDGTIADVDMAKQYLDNEGQPVHIDYNGTTQALTIPQALAIANVQKHGEKWSTTGKPRVTGALDLPHLAGLVKKEWKYVSVSRLDAIDGLDEFPVVVWYIYKWDQDLVDRGKIYRNWDKITLKDTLPAEHILRHCQPIYKKIKWWKSSKPDANREINTDLLAFLRYLERETGVKIVSYGNGPLSEDLVSIISKNVKETVDLKNMSTNSKNLWDRLGRMVQRALEKDTYSKTQERVLRRFGIKISMSEIWDAQRVEV